MRTVTQVSKLTGISVRTLHYYDEIGLLKPTMSSESGYRLYDDEAMEKLEQVLYFREFDFPLKEIKEILSHPDYDRNAVFESQRKMIQIKRDRFNRMLENIDQILKGENTMNFDVFSKEEMEDIFHSMMEHMSKEQTESIQSKYGSMEEYENYFMNQAGRKGVQENMQKLTEWYGDKDAVINAAKNPPQKEELEQCQSQVDELYRKLVECKKKNSSIDRVNELMKEYDAVSKQIYQMQDVTSLMLEMAELYATNDNVKEAMNQQYGMGAADFIASAMKSFYTVQK